MKPSYCENILLDKEFGIFLIINALGTTRIFRRAEIFDPEFSHAEFELQNIPTQNLFTLTCSHAHKVRPSKGNKQRKENWDRKDDYTCELYHKNRFLQLSL
jgi:hypothetical protein